MVWQFVTPTLRSPEHRPIHAFLTSLAISVPQSRSTTTVIHLNAQDGAIVTYGQASSATVAGTGRRRGERDGGQQSCPLCWPYECPQVSLSSGAAHSYFGAALSSKNKEKKTILRIYGIEGEGGREGEGWTRISESSYRRAAAELQHVHVPATATASRGLGRGPRITEHRRCQRRSGLEMHTHERGRQFWGEDRTCIFWCGSDASGTRVGSITRVAKF